MTPQTVLDRTKWNNAVTGLSGCHLLQSWEWGELKKKYGWDAHHLLWTNKKNTPIAAAQILQRKLPVPGLHDRFSLLYCPRGPVLDWSKTRCAARYSMIFAASRS